MDSSNPPAAPPTQAVTETPTSPPPTAPVKAPALSPEKFARLLGGFDAVLVVLVVGFAFLVASFPAYNPDFFRQLACGRLLAQGDYQFGVDPFTYTSDGTYQVNHSWLFALFSYGLYQIPNVGGIVLVALKAALLAVLAAVLLWVGRRAGQSLWIPAACTALAVLTISIRVYLQPICLSYLYLGLTLWILTSGRAAPRRWWLLPPLFALWVNCDQWFFVGPLLVALYLLGELLQPLAARFLEGQSAASAKESKTASLAVVLAVGLAACLLNPHHIHAFELPAELGLSPAGDRIEQDAQFRSMFLSPLQIKEYFQPSLGLSAAGLSYVLLLLAGVVSFVFAFRRAPLWRLTVWLGFAGLSLYTARAVPFFAVVAGPITALNWLDYAVHRLGETPRLTPGWRAWSLGGRAATILLVLLLLAAAVPGWTQGQPWEYHRVGWDVVIDPALAEAAQQIQRWRENGVLPADKHWFNNYTEVANYLAWFAPGERVFLDQSLPWSPHAADDYLAIRQGLERTIRDEEAAPDEEPGSLRPAKRDWRAVFRERGIGFWILDNRGAGKADLVSHLTLFGGREEWQLCYLQGRIAIFAWNDLFGKKSKESPQRAARVGPPALDLMRVAFGTEADRAPAQGPERPEEAQPDVWTDWSKDLWNVWWNSRPTLAPHKDTARLHDIRFTSLQPFFAHDNARAWQRAVFAGAVGNALPNGPVPHSLLLFNWSCIYEDLFPAGAQRPRRPPSQVESVALKAHNLYVAGQDSGPVESLYLTIRAARRAIRANPEDAQTYAMLGHAYLRLMTETQERFLTQTESPLAIIRRTQMAAAYENCLRLLPSRPSGEAARLADEAHAALFSLFVQKKYMDVALEHLREQLNHLRAAGPRRGETLAQHTNQLEQLSQYYNRLEGDVKRQQSEYDAMAVNMPVLEQAQQARKKGLVKSALNVLMNADLKDLQGPGGLPGKSLMIELLLDLGQVEDAAKLLIPDPEAVAGQPVPPAEVDYRLRLAAARGDYEEADRILDAALKDAWKNPNGQSQLRSTGISAALLVGRVLSAEALRLGGVLRAPWLSINPNDILRHPLLAQSPTDFWIRRWRLELLEQTLPIEQQRADWHLERGWLALESGACVAARQYFRSVLASLAPLEVWEEVDRLQVIVAKNELEMLLRLQMQQIVTQELSQRYLKWLKQAQGPAKPRS